MNGYCNGLFIAARFRLLNRVNLMADPAGGFGKGYAMPDWFRSRPGAMPPLPDVPGPKVPAGGMPALPPTPKPKPRVWANAKMPTQLPDDNQGISAAVVMQHFSR